MTSIRARWSKLRERPVERSRLQELAGLSLFQTLGNKELRAIDELLHDRVYQTDEVVFDVGDVGLGLFLIVSGRVKVVPPAELPEASVAEIGPGEFFGEMALFEDAPRMAQVVAIEETRITVMFRTDFFSLLQEDKNIAVKILFQYARMITARARRILVSDKHRPGA